MASQGGSKEAGRAGATVKQTTLVGLEAPRLRSMEMKDMILFIRAREVYENTVAEKNKESGVNIPLASYRVSVEHNVLRMMWRAKWIVSDSLESITDNDIKTCVRDRSKRNLDTLNSEEVDAIVKKVRMKMHIREAESRVWTLALDYEKALEDAGFKDVLDRFPHIAIEHMAQKCEPTLLKSTMRDLMKVRKAEGFHKNDFFRFVGVMAAKATVIQETLRLQQPSDNEKKNRKEDPKRKTRDGEGDKGKGQKSDGVKSTTDNTASSKKRKISCLNSKCNEHHLVKDCPITSDAEKERLLEEYRKKKKDKSLKKDAKKVAKLTKAECLNHSTLFSASFLDGAVEATVMADPGSDDNLMPQSVFCALAKAKKDLGIEVLKKPIEFNLAIIASKTGEKVVATCRKAVVATVNLRIRHGNGLIMRDIRWAVSDEDGDCVLIGRPVLESMGVNVRSMLEAVAAENNGIVSIPDLMKEKESRSEGSRTLASVLRDGIFHKDGGEEDDFLDEANVYIDIGEDAPGELDVALRNMVDEAKSEGLSESSLSILTNMVMSEFRSIFKIRLGKTAPAKVEPMVIKIKDGATPVRVKARRYPAFQRSFLNAYVDKLVEMGYLVPNKSVSWQCAPLLVPKPGSSAKLRMTIDLRPINSATKKEAWPMPHIDSELQDLSGSTCFASIDFVSGYWQLPVHPDSRDACGIVTPNGVYSSTRVLQGLTNATSHFQGTIEPLFSAIRKNLKAWLDDFNLYAKTEGQMLALLRTFFEICRDHNLFLSAKKCKLFKKEIRWCGRIIGKDGYKMDPSRVSGLRELDLPKYAGELCEYVHCCRWMSIGIPLFAERVSLLTSVLEEAYTLSKKRTKRSIKNIPLSKLSWGDKHIAAFKSIQESLINAVSLSHLKEDYIVCIFTDASIKFWSGVVTQTMENQLALPFGEQKHEPLAFLGAEFKGAEQRWTTYEQESFAIFNVFLKLDYLFYGAKPVHVFTDHRNLLFVFSPLAMEPTLGRHIVTKVQRWGLFLSRFSYVIEHIPGNQNVFADVLTRWLKGYRSEPRALRRVSRSTIAAQIIPSSASATFKWPSWEMIQDSQSNASSKPKHAVEEDGVIKVDGRIWIPPEDIELQLKVMVVSHCGGQGHRGQAATESTIREAFVWDNIKADVQEFVRGCIHCIVTRTGEVIPRPLGSAIHGSKPNEVVHMDFLYMGSSSSMMKYILVLRDDISGYTWLWPSIAANSETAAAALARWGSCFGSMKWLVTDQGSHFVNRVIKELTEELRIQHHFTTAYSPWANGTVERVCRETLRACKSLLSEWGLGPRDWPDVTESMQSILNQSPIKRLGRRGGELAGVFRTPLEVFTGIIPVRPLLRALPLSKHDTCFSTDASRVRSIAKVDQVLEALDQMHRELAASIGAARRRQIEDHNKRCGVKPVNFGKGDFVLVRRAQKKGHKLAFRWRGPRRVVDVRGDLVFEVESLVDKARENVHARRLLLYRADLDGASVDESLIDYAEHTESSYETAVSLKDIRDIGDDINVRVEWDGLPDEQDWTWEPLANLAKDIPDMLEEYLQTGRKRKLKQKASTRCF